VVVLGVSGCEISARLAKIRLETEFLYISGRDIKTVVRRCVLDSAKPFLRKPFTPNALTRQVRKVLDSQAPIWHDEGPPKAEGLPISRVNGFDLA
jgi:FixJ family two-component response regulator